MPVWLFLSHIAHLLDFQVSYGRQQEEHWATLCDEISFNLGRQQTETVRVSGKARMARERRRAHGNSREPWEPRKGTGTPRGYVDAVAC